MTNPEMNEAVARIEMGLKGLIKAANRTCLTEASYAIFKTGLAKIMHDIETGTGFDVGGLYSDDIEKACSAFHDLWWESRRKA